MKVDITSFQAVAANLAIEGEVCDLAPTTVSTGTETDTEIAAFIDKVRATSIAEIDRLIPELQDAKNYLLSERERIERETVRYANLTLIASATTKIISDAVSQCHPLSNNHKYTPEEIDGVLAELLSAAYFLIMSPAMLRLQTHIKQELSQLT